MSLHSRTVRTARAASDPYLWGQNGATEQTFIMIKPDAVGTPWLSHEITTDEEGNEVANDVVRANDKADAIKDRIEKEGFTIVRQRRVRLSKAQAQAFYAEHEGREFFEGLTDFMSSAPIIAMVLEKENAIKSWRELIGPTNSNLAREEAEAKSPLDQDSWSIRALFGTDGQKNAVHGSDSAYSASREIDFFFSDELQLERTCCVIMPEAVGKADEIIVQLRDNDYAVIARADQTCTADQASGYFPPNMTDQITALTAGPSIVLALEKKGAVRSLAKALGVDATGLYGSMSEEAASAHLHYWFPNPFPLERTLALIKPGTADTSAKDIMEEIRSQGFTIIQSEKMQLSKERAGLFYKEHKGKSFYGRLTNYMSSGPIVAMILSKPGAILAWRTLMGPTNTLVARNEKPNSIRARFGVDGTRNATHGSDSLASAKREIAFYFPSQAGNSAPMLTGDAAKDYLATKRCTEEKSMNQVLVDGLVALCKAKPIGTEAIRYLGKWLIENNPARPGAKAPSSAAQTDAPPAPATTGATAMAVPTSNQYPNNGVAIPMPEEAAKKIVFMMGGPGAGKGTQCKSLVKEFGYTHLSTGDLLRSEVAKGSELGLKAKAVMDAGELVSDELVLNLLKNAMADSGSNKFLIDGYPRVLEQAWAFEKEIGAPTMVLSFDVSDETMTTRLINRGKSSGRSDDNAETIKKRLVTFHEQTDPTIQFYERLGCLRRVNADGLSREQVYENTRVHFQPEVVFVAGPPGAGKGTQCKRIMDKYGYEHLSTGDLLKAEVARGSKRGTEIARLIKNGQLVPDDITLAVLKRAMDRSASSKFLVDGFPRNVDQALAFEQNIGPCKFVLHITADADVCSSRLLGSGNAGDSKGALGKRMKTYNTKTQKVIELYTQKNAVRTVDGNGTSDETYAKVVKCFDPTIVFVVSSGGLDNSKHTLPLAAASGYTHLVPGHLLRGEILRGSAEGQMIENMTSTGQIIPVDTTHGLIQKAMINSGNDKFIIDMYPRALDQATAFENQVGYCTKLIHYKSSEENVIAGHKANNTTNEDVIARRIRTFNTQTVPVLNYYAVQGRVKQIDADASVEEVAAAGMSALSASTVLAVGGPSKSKQCKSLSAEFNYVNISMGNLIDATITLNGPMGQRMAAAQDGEDTSIATDDKIALLKDVISKNHRSNKFIITGFPNNQSESDAMESAIGAPSNVLYFAPDCEEAFQPVLEGLVNRGLVTAISTEGSDDEIYRRARESFRPTLVLSIAKPFETLANVMTNACLNSNACKIDVTSLLLEEADTGSAAGNVIRDAVSSGRTVPVDITVDIINKVVRDAPTNNFIIEGYPRLVSAGFPGVQDQLAALDSSVGDVAQMVYMNIQGTVGPEATRFRLEREPVVSYLKRVDRAEEVDMSEESEEAVNTALGHFSTYFDAESRAAKRAQFLTEIENAERVRREEEAAKEEFGEDEAEAGADEEEA